jgi:branched-subunit amino acid ABC-type transport system permease component
MKPRGSELVFGLRPWSISAFSLALSLLAAAIAARMLLSLLGVNFYFGTFLPAILAAAFFAGIPSGIFAAALSIPIVWWMFLPPPFVFSTLTVADYNQFAEFLLVSTLLIWFAHLCRQAP